MQSIVTAQWLQEHLQDPKLVLLFVMGLKKDQNDLAADNQQIPGSQWFDLKNTFQHPTASWPNTVPEAADFTAKCQQLGINQDSTIILYDANGVYATPRAWWLFRLMGHQRVAVLDGGLPAWLANGGSTEAFQQNPVKRGNFTADFQKDRIRYTADMLHNTQQPREQVLDARSAGRFAGTEAEPRAGMKSGHIPGSNSLPFTEVIHNGKFRPTHELAQIFDKLDLDDRPLVFSCGSGITACIILLAAEQVLKQSKAVYDGSWTEWASTNGLPIGQQTG